MSEHKQMLSGHFWGVIIGPDGCRWHVYEHPGRVAVVSIMGPPGSWQWTTWGALEGYPTA